MCDGLRVCVIKVSEGYLMSLQTYFDRVDVLISEIHAGAAHKSWEVCWEGAEWTQMEAF